MLVIQDTNKIERRSYRKTVLPAFLSPDWDFIITGAVMMSERKCRQEQNNNNADGS